MQGRDGGAGQLRADRVHVEAAGAAAVVHALDGRVAEFAAARVLGEHGRLERERVLAVEGERRGRRARRAELVEVEVAAVAEPRCRGAPGGAPCGRRGGSASALCVLLIWCWDLRNCAVVLRR